MGKKFNHLLYVSDLKLYEESKEDNMEVLENTGRMFTDDINTKQVCYSCHEKREDDGRWWNTNSWWDSYRRSERSLSTEV